MTDALCVGVIGLLLRRVGRQVRVLAHHLLPLLRRHALLSESMNLLHLLGQYLVDQALSGEQCLAFELLGDHENVVFPAAAVGEVLDPLLKDPDQDESFNSDIN